MLKKKTVKNGGKWNTRESSRNWYYNHIKQITIKLRVYVMEYTSPVIPFTNIY